MSPRGWRPHSRAAMLVDRGRHHRRQHAASGRRRSLKGGGPPLIRDAEIEQLLREYAQPVLKVAGLAQQNVQVVIINDRVLQCLRR